MFRHPFFCCACPVCGRPLQIREEYLGRRITCPHCGGQFHARRPAHPALAGTVVRNPLVERANRLLAISARRLFAAAVPATSAVGAN